jgi:glycosyltransferase involved in cell wall biosynthesis
LQTQAVRLNVIVPCYNPPQGWAEALAGRFAAFQAAVADLAGEIRLVVVNDGSTSESSELIFKRLEAILPKVRIVSYPENHGKGYALRQGVAASEADLHVVTDADFPYTIESMRRIVATLRESGGIAAGNRDTAYYEQVPASRRRLSQALRWLLRNVLRQPIGDSQCGLKGFDNAGKKVFLETTIDRFLFDLEFLMLAGGRVPVTPVPVELREGVTFSKVGWKILATEGRNFMWLLLRKKVD